MAPPRFLLRRAREREFDAIVGLIDETARWLRTKGTDQWLRPWPDRPARDQRVLAGLRSARTWVVMDGRTLVATVTVEHDANPKLWNERETAEPAVYAHRLVVRRPYAGAGLGARLLDLAGLRAREQYGARWIRVDVWTTNQALHAYYERQGFRFHRRMADPTYPSGALFQKPTDGIGPAGAPAAFAEAEPFSAYPGGGLHGPSGEPVRAFPWLG